MTAALWGSEFLLNATLPGRQDASKVVALKNGGFFATWTETPVPPPVELIPTGAVLKGRFFDANGKPIGSELTISSAADAADATVLTDGRVVVSFAKEAGGVTEIHAKVYNPSGAAAGESFKVNTQASVDTYSGITALSDGGFAIAYKNMSNSKGLLVQSFDQSLNRKGIEYALNPPEGAEFQSYPEIEISALPNGRFAIIGAIRGGEGLDGIFGYSLSAGEAPPAIPNLTLKSNTEGTLYFNAKLLPLADGRMALTWVEVSPDFRKVSLKAKIVGTDKEVVVTTHSGSGDERFIKLVGLYSAVALKDGGFAVAATNIANIQEIDTDISLSVFSSNGDLVSVKDHVNTTSKYIQAVPSLTELADGRILLSWIDGEPRIEDNRIKDSELRAQIVDTRSKAVVVTGAASDDEYVGTPFGDRISGGAGADHLRGEGGNDTLDGGTGADRLEGGLGDDVYYVDTIGDVVIEALGGGKDTAIASGTYALSAAAEVEVLKFSGVSSKTSASLTGSGTNNEIFGHSGTNTLKGQGGNDILYGSSGNDKLYGGSGKGIFVFDSKLNKTKNVDRVYDFSSKHDSFHMENKIFTKLGAGSASKPKKFKSDMFVEGKTAQDAEDRIVYDRKTGSLYYDQDGTGSKAQVKIATIATKVKLTHNDFFVI